MAVDYATLKKGGFMRQKQKNNFSLRLAVVLAGLGSCAEQEEDEKPCKERQPQEKRAADRRKAG